MNYKRVAVIKDRATRQEIGSLVQDDAGEFHLHEQGTLIQNEGLPHIVRRLIVAIGEVFEGPTQHELTASEPKRH